MRAIVLAFGVTLISAYLFLYLWSGEKFKQKWVSVVVADFGLRTSNTPPSYQVSSTVSEYPLTFREQAQVCYGLNIYREKLLRLTKPV